jgi:hypothetical protein
MVKAAFLCLQLVFAFLWQKENVKKPARKRLIKFTMALLQPQKA